MARKSVPRQKRDDRPQPVSSGNQQVTGADGVRAKLHDRRRRHHQHGESGRQLGLASMLAVAGVAAVLAVAAYYWYVSVIRDIVRTPLQAPRFGDATPSAARQDMDRFWGSYRSGLYFGMKTRSPRSPVVGKKKTVAMFVASRKYSDLPCDLPCAASLAGIQPVRPRAQRTSP